MNDNQKEAARKKSLGELGELFSIKTLVDENYDKIRNLNDEHMNEPYADIYCEKEGKRLVISVKARNKYQKDGKLNSSYKLGSNFYEKAAKVASKYDAEPYWMAIQFDAQNIQIKLVSNPKGFNQIDKRWVDQYVEMWNIPKDVADLLKYFTGEYKPYK